MEITTKSYGTVAYNANSTGGVVYYNITAGTGWPIPGATYWLYYEANAVKDAANNPVAAKPIESNCRFTITDDVGPKLIWHSPAAGGTAKVDSLVYLMFHETVARPAVGLPHETTITLKGKDHGDVIFADLTDPNQA